MFLLYNFLLTLLAPFWVPWMIYRARRRKEQPNWAERQGNLPLEMDSKAQRVWIHAVSVGEVMAARPILKELRARLPGFTIVLSTTTSSGHRTARESAEGLFDTLVYFPLDIARFQLVAMQRVRPKVVAIMETELWMNFLWAAKVFATPTLLINGRISDKHFPRTLRARFFYNALLKNMDRCLMQSEEDARRIRALGAQAVEVFGNSKFDEAANVSLVDPAYWQTELALPPDKPVIVVGSTRGETEERLVLDALAKVGFERVTVIHAPRHLERGPALAAEVREAAGAVALRSARETGPYLVLDTYGELGELYSVADVVIVGGGFDDLGGQNIVQPLAHGKPVLHGPHMQNFREVAAMAQAAGATKVCATAAELALALNELLADPTERARMGAAAKELVERNVGASRRYAEAIAEQALANG